MMLSKITRAALRYVLAAGVLLFGAVHAHAGECGERYFAPGDHENMRPLRQPHSMFKGWLVGAKAGKPDDQRSVAASYEAGYLVSACPHKAAYWYDKAAQGGDQLAREWTARHQVLERLMAGPECVDDQCFGNRKGDVRVAMFFAGPMGHYFAPVTINGVTETGMIDTGASHIAMSEEMAQRFGIAQLPATAGRGHTANGIINTRSITVPLLSISGMEMRDVRVSIGISGPMLIGMSFLSRVSVKMENGRLALSR
jgi:clan AA aspartic protease (TIGR02281 family)